MIIVYGHEINVTPIYEINWGSFHYYMFLNGKCESESVKFLGLPRLFVTPRTVARKTPLSMEISRQEHLSGLPHPSGDLPNPGIERGSLALLGEGNGNPLQCSCLENPRDAGA